MQKVNQVFKAQSKVITRLEFKVRSNQVLKVMDEFHDSTRNQSMKNSVLAPLPYLNDD